MQALCQLRVNGVNRHDPTKRSTYFYDGECPLRQGSDLKLHQRECIGQIRAFELDLNLRGGLICDDMGLGQMVEAMALDRIYPVDQPTLIVTPASILPNWLAECTKHFSLLSKIHYHNVSQGSFSAV